ncbi:hypothetical protein SAMN02745823_00329 [Sporobacter termitidis DSM 10068]|uniref:Uncharacterized protein n=2 Tax=Sporobacter TaxID=44748 RepID=A0A1M5U283_9FIRM|nr:hypothetical protein SAMN02745823_00329 [Sporobacter termitidis DSM 10068]
MPRTPTIEMTRKQLYDEVWEISVAGVAKKYNIEYGQLIKQVKEADIPIPPSGYWTKLSFGKPTEKIMLPGSEDTIVSIYSVIPATRRRKNLGKTAPKNSIEKESPKISVAVPLKTDESDSPKPDKVVTASNVAADNAQILQQLGEPKTMTQYGQTYNIYDREILYKEVWALPVTEVAKKYKVSDVAIHKICKSLKIPTPPMGYWAKVRAGKQAAKQPPLPENDKIKQKTGPQTGFTSPHAPADTPSLDFLGEEDRAILLAVATQIQMTSDNDKMHTKIVTHRQAVLAWDKDDKVAHRNWRGNRTDGKTPPLLWGSISLDSLSRACRIFDTLIRAMEPLGCTLTADLKFIVRGETIPISISESQSKIDHLLTKDEQREMLIYQDAQKHGGYASKPNIRKYDYVYNGKLCFGIANYKSFSDSKTNLLEDRLGDILISIYEAAERIYVQRLAAEEAERKRQEEKARKEARRERYNVEVQRTNALMNAAEDFNTACKIRAYVASVETQDNLTAEARSWVEWAKQKADWLDPTVARDDEFFGTREHEEDADHKKLKESYSSYGW